MALFILFYFLNGVGIVVKASDYHIIIGHITNHATLSLSHDLPLKLFRQKKKKKRLKNDVRLSASEKKNTTWVCCRRSLLRRKGDDESSLYTTIMLLQRKI